MATRLSTHPPPPLPFSLWAVHYLLLTLTALIDLPTCLWIDVTHLFRFTSPPITTFPWSSYVSDISTFLLPQSICLHIYLGQFRQAGDDIRHPDTHIYMGWFPEDWENGHFVSLRVNKFYGPPSGVSWVFMIQITQNNCEIKSSSSVLGERGLYFFLFLRTRNCHIPRPRETKPLCVYLDVWCHCQPSLVVMKPVLFAHSPFSESTWPDSEKRVCGGVQYLLMWQLVTDETWQWKGWVRWGVYYLSVNKTDLSVT